MTIRRLSPRDAPVYRRLRLQALRECPSTYGKPLGVEARQSLGEFEKRLEVRPDNWVFGSFDGGNLVGILRLIREKGGKERHKANIYSVYVAPSRRKEGIARLLLDRALRAAARLKIRQVRIGVVLPNPAAIALYEKAGFVEYGREKGSLCVAGVYHDESLMVRKLRTA